MTFGKPRWGYLLVIKFQLQLFLFALFLIANVFAYGFFIQTNPTDTISPGPKVQARYPFVAQYRAAELVNENETPFRGI
jgi:hypothetical protein